jgi:hypothetical protein
MASLSPNGRAGPKMVRAAPGEWSISIYAAGYFVTPVVADMEIPRLLNSPDSLPIDSFNGTESAVAFAVLPCLAGKFPAAKAAAKPR